MQRFIFSFVMVCVVLWILSRIVLAAIIIIVIGAGLLLLATLCVLYLGRERSKESSAIVPGSAPKEVNASPAVSASGTISERPD